MQDVIPSKAYAKPMVQPAIYRAPAVYHEKQSFSFSLELLLERVKPDTKDLSHTMEGKSFMAWF